MSAINNQLRDVLENAGWYEGRQISIDYIIDELWQDGYDITQNKIIQNLLREFWNLNIEFKNHDGTYSNVRLNTERVGGVSQQVVQKISELIHEKIIPLATIHDDSAILFVSENGRFYMGVDEQFYRIGNDFFEALDTIINQKEVLKFSFL